MVRIVHVHIVDKDGFLKGNIESNPDEVDLVFKSSPAYAEVLKQVRIELKRMYPNDVFELEERHNVGFGLHIHRKTMHIHSEQHWVVYKKTVVESLDKALGLFSTKKVDASLHLDLNRLASPFDSRSLLPMMIGEEIP